MAQRQQITRPRPAAPVDTVAARAEIEATRARISDTIDEIEEVLVTRKEELQDRLDILSPVRERPLLALGVAFGTALALALLTGGGKGGRRGKARASLARDAEEALHELQWGEEGEDGDESWDDVDLWEERARRLRRIAQAQQVELSLRAQPAREGILDRVKEVAAERLAALAEDFIERALNRP